MMFRETSLDIVKRWIPGELLLLVGFVFLVCSVALPSVWAVEYQKCHTVVRADLRAMLEAADSFYSEYGHWPSPVQTEVGDLRFGRERSNAEVVEILMAEETGVTEADVGAVNEKNIVFLEISSLKAGFSGLNERAELLDPWGVPYQIVLDTDLNNRCDFKSSIYHSRIGEGISAWSVGPDGKSGTSDDILSWSID